MKNFSELYEAIINSGKRMEAFTTKFDSIGCEVIEQTVIRVELKPWIWFTWSGVARLEDDVVMFFDGRYNQNNGANQKTIRKEWGALYELGLQDWK